MKKETVCKGRAIVSTEVLRLIVICDCGAKGLAAVVFKIFWRSGFKVADLAKVVLK